MTGSVADWLSRSVAGALKHTWKAQSSASSASSLMTASEMSAEPTGGEFALISRRSCSRITRLLKSGVCDVLWLILARVFSRGFSFGNLRIDLPITIAENVNSLHNCASPASCHNLCLARGVRNYETQSKAHKGFVTFHFMQY